MTFSDGEYGFLIFDKEKEQDSSPVEIPKWCRSKENI